MSQEEDMQRTLVSEFGPLAWSTDRDGIVTPSIQGSYSNLSNAGTAETLFVEEVSIDLSGYAMDKKTFFPYSSFEQRSGPTSASFADTSTGRMIRDIIIVSSVPLDVDYDTMVLYAVFDLPGFNSGNITGGDITAYRINRDPLMHQHKLVLAHDTTTATTGGSSIYRVVSSSNASSLEPTAADLLYCYRIVYSASTDGGALLPAARVLLPGMITTEPKLEYMMRLKRSYELANQV